MNTFRDTVRDDTKKMFRELKQKRDELAVQVHLAKLEAGDEWQEIEKKFERLELKMKELSHATAESSKDIGITAKQIGKDIRDGFKKIVKHF